MFLFQKEEMEENKGFYYRFSKKGIGNFQKMLTMDAGLVTGDHVTISAESDGVLQ